MKRLSRPIGAMARRYDVVVVGSGYGGGIAAYRLADARHRTCVLERGREIPPGEYPDTLLGALGELQLDLPSRHLFSPVGLYDLRVNKDISVFLGCGLGGTSLINANVAEWPTPAVFQDGSWPEEIQREAQNGGSALCKGRNRAEDMLKVQRYPGRDLLKLQALDRAARSLPGASERGIIRPPLAVEFKAPGPLPARGLPAEHACVGCGDCMTGCNYGAKNTVLKKYLPEARRAGAHIFTETCVRWIEKTDGGWIVRFDLHGAGRDRFGAPPLSVMADRVLLAAGTLGTTEILLRSRDHGLALSGELGKHFTGNGDVLAFSYNGDQDINGLGVGRRQVSADKPVGPCIAGMIDLRPGDASWQSGIVIEEGTVAGALAPAVGVTLAAMAIAQGALYEDRDGSLRRDVRRFWRTLSRGGFRAARNTLTLLAMAHDNGQGVMSLAGDDRLRIEWPRASRQTVFAHVSEQLREVTRTAGGAFLERMSDLVTVHPLGGCRMSNDAAHGVVNHAGQVFDPARGAVATHPGLYISDGSVIPRPLGVNPLLTISALAERTCALMLGPRA
jgi:cholesterol oxidase